MSNKRKLNSISSLPSDERPGADMVKDREYPGPGAINAYRCPTCERYRVVQHVDKGVTPMFMICADPDCKGQAVSMMYPDQKHIPEKIRKAVRWEWYRPDMKEYRKLDPDVRSHVLQGGLLIREKTT